MRKSSDVFSMTFWVQSAVIIDVIVDVKTGIKKGGSRAAAKRF